MQLQHICEVCGVATTVLRHFPKLPKIRRMFLVQEITSLFTWHHFYKFTDGLMRHPMDSSQWPNIDLEYSYFGAKPCNLRVMISVDGIDPFGFKSLKWFCTPMVMTIANLLPWCMTKKFFLTLCLLIPSKETMRGANLTYFLNHFWKD